MIGKISYSREKDQEETLQRVAHGSTLSECLLWAFSPEGMDQQAVFTKKMFRLAESWNECACSSLICELHCCCALDVKWEQPHVINKYR